MGGGPQPHHLAYNETDLAQSCRSYAYYRYDLKFPIDAKFDGGKAHRMVIAPELGARAGFGYGGERSFYANTVGPFGVVSDGRHWGRLACAVHRRELKLV